ncbi:hypothetical protein QBC38DRAFT_367807 [Podospora fimiseda]|uniref:Uncharacterized protein n=1 Tax=Podospora fimiseda TaxID=252190 RepID=A0AAN7BM65_9PEZI|nr:hypothetical protein QBC38DRAFT_367807 [Podospora fimiseda]
MSSPQGSPTDRNAQRYMLVNNMHVPDSTGREIELDSHPWMMATVIEDDDLMFGGKPLSTWYEEDRRRFSCGNDEEEHRGRQRERADVYSVQHSHQNQHQNQHQHQPPKQHRHHGKTTKEVKH